MSKLCQESSISSVITQFALDSPIEVRAGENFFQKLEDGEIVDKNGVIQEIGV